MRRRAADIEQLPQIRWPHNPHIRMGLKTPLQSVIARHQVAEFHGLGLCNDATVVETSMMLYEFIDAPLDDRIRDTRIVVK